MGLLRLLLAMCVFGWHSQGLAGLSWLAGNVAVECFFVISGFYMQLILNSKYTRDRLGGEWFKQFYKARYFRLLPAYLTAGALAVGLSLLRDDEHMAVWRYVADLPAIAGNLCFQIFLVLTNLTILFQDAIMFLAARGGEIHWTTNFTATDSPLWNGLAVPQAWSLGIEISFYLCAPFLLNLRSRWLAAAVGLGLVVKIATVKVWHLEDPWTYRFFPFELGYFLLGALVYRYREVLAGPTKWRLEWFWYGAYLLAFAFVVQPPNFLGALTNPLVLAALLPLFFRLTARSRADRLIGEVSYPFYVFHLFALDLVGWASGTPVNGAAPTGLVWAALALTLLLSIAAVGLEMRFLEPWRARFADPLAFRPVAKDELV